MFYHAHEMVGKGVPSVVWQQQMETNFIERHKKVHVLKYLTPSQQNTAKQNFPTLRRQLTGIANHEPHFIEPPYQRNHCWDGDLHFQEKLALRHNYNEPLEHNEDHNKFRLSRVGQTQIHLDRLMDT